MARPQLSFDFAVAPERGSTHPEPAPAAVVRPASALLDADSGVPEALKESALVLTDRLAAVLGRPVRLVVTDNRRTMVSARALGGRIEVRLHHMFLEADERVVVSLGRYLACRDRAAGARIDAFIEAQRHRIAQPKRRRTLLRTRGTVHDLKQLYRELLGDFPPGAMDGVRVTWGRRVRRRAGQRSIQLGTYAPRDQLIRIHPVLDQEWVPAFYVASVLFHEMLHHAVPPERSGGQVRYHTPAFRARERAFRHHREAERWEKAHLARLLRGG